jgi:ribosomal protein L29
MKVTEIRDKSVEQLTQLAAELAEQLRATKTALRTNSYTRSHELGAARKLRAQVLTILSQKRTITRS